MLSSSHQGRQSLHQAFVAGSGYIVQEQHIRRAGFFHQGREFFTLHFADIAVIYHIHLLIIRHQERDKGVAERLLDDDAGAAVRLIGVFDYRPGIVAADKAGIFRRGIPSTHIGHHHPLHAASIAGREAQAVGVIGLIRSHRIAAGEGRIFARITVKRPQKSRILHRGKVFFQIGRYRSACLAVILIGVISTQSRPVVIGAEINILIAVISQRVVHIYLPNRFR